jgi:hypothetical protein
MVSIVSMVSMVSMCLLPFHSLRSRYCYEPSSPQQTPLKDGYPPSGQNIRYTCSFHDRLTR